MSASLFSQSWYKVADLKVRLRKHADIHRHVYRDQVWYVLQDHVTGQFQRFSPQAYQIIGFLDGKRTLDQIWHLACDKLGDDLPTQDEVIQLIGQLNKANVIQTDSQPDIEQLKQRYQIEQKRKWQQQLKSPLSIKIPLLDPEHFLERTKVIGQVLFSKFGALLWLITVIAGGMLAVSHWSALTNNLSDQVLGLENLFLMALAYPLVKLAHELGHGYAVKRWGGEVHEMGIMLLIFIPVPYVDASAASSFRNKYQRMLVGAIGVLSELWMASLAMIVWVMVEPGLVRALAYNVMLIGGISTLLFNGNPLLRFDAYYVLADYLEIPNLGARGNAQVSYLLKRYLFRIQSVRTNAHSVKESIWLASYAVLAYCYRLFVMVVISLFIATKYFFVGILLAIWSIWMTLVLPICKAVMQPMKDHAMQQKKTRIYGLGFGLLACLFGLLFYLPVPHHTYAQGVIYVPQQSIIRAEMSGFIAQLAIDEGQQVEQGQVLLQMVEPALSAKDKVLQAQLLEAQARYKSVIHSRSEADIVRQELTFIEQESQEIAEQLAQLTVASPSDGQVIFKQRQGIEGRYYLRGDVIGYVIDYQNLPLTVMVAEDDLARVQNDSKQVLVKFASQPQTQYVAEIQRQIPALTKQLPSSVLSTEGGGLIALDPSASEDLTSYRSYFRLELSPQQMPPLRFDERVYVRFEHQAEPIAYRWSRELRRLLLSQFDV